jgi:hypothetical protein
MLDNPLDFGPPIDPDDPFYAPEPEPSLSVEMREETARPATYFPSPEEADAMWAALAPEPEPQLRPPVPYTDPYAGGLPDPDPPAPPRLPTEQEVLSSPVAPYIAAVGRAGVDATAAPLFPPILSPRTNPFVHAALEAVDPSLVPESVPTPLPPGSEANWTVVHQRPPLPSQAPPGWSVAGGPTDYKLPPPTPKTIALPGAQLRPPDAALNTGGVTSGLFDLMWPNVERQMRVTPGFEWINWLDPEGAPMEPA